jgi:hypothetical protein
MYVPSTPEPQRISTSPIARWVNAGKLGETGDRKLGWGLSLVPFLISIFNLAASLAGEH